MMKNVSKVNVIGFMDLHCHYMAVAIDALLWNKYIEVMQQSILSSRLFDIRMFVSLIMWYCKAFSLVLHKFADFHGYSLLLD